MAVELKEKVEKLFKQWDALFTRQKEDADAFNLVQVSTHVLDANGKEIPNSVSIILNDIADFAWRVETALNSADEQVAVTLENKQFDTAYVENFIKASFKEADKRMPDKDLFPLNPFLDQQTCRRGRACVVPLFQIKDGELIPDITPWDTGYVISTPAIKAYKGNRTKEQIEG